MVDDVIGEVDLGMCEPWDLPELSKVKSKDPQWYFFNKLRVKYRKSNKCSRATQAGYWKITCKDCSIKRSGTNNIIGIRKTLVFYIGRSATNWLIHEFHSLTFPDEKKSFVLCKLMKKDEKKDIGGAHSSTHDKEGGPSSPIVVHSENQVTADQIPNVHASPKVNLESLFLEQPQPEEYDFWCGLFKPKK